MKDNKEMQKREKVTVEAVIRSHCLYDYVEAVRKQQREHPEYDNVRLLEAVVRQLVQETVRERTRALVRLSQDRELTQEKLNSFLAGWDIETVQADEAMMLAYAMNDHPELDFGVYSGPRLKGLISYYRFRNLELTSHFSRIVRKFNEEGIVPMVLKGGAMKHLRPELPRHMGDMDVLTADTEQWKKAQKIVTGIGYTYDAADHSFDVHLPAQPDKGILDVHRRFSFLRDTEEKYLQEIFQRASRREVFRTEVYLPCVDDMVFIQIHNLAKNVRERGSLFGMPFTVFDLAYLTKTPEFSWDNVLKYTSENHLQASFFIAAVFLNELVPGTVPSDVLSGGEYTEEISRFMELDKRYIRRVWNSPLKWRFSAFLRNLLRLPVFEKHPGLVLFYEKASVAVYSGLTKALRRTL